MKYGQKVRVTSGFYEGMEGIAIREKYLGLMAGTVLIDIMVRLEIEGDIHEIVFPESNLEIIN